MKNKVFANKHEVNFDLMREDRINAGLDQELCAECLGLNPSAISSWECGKRTPKINHLVRFAELMGKKPDRYVGGEALKQVRLYVVKTRAIADYVKS